MNGTATAGQDYASAVGTLMGRLKLSGARFYVSADNLYTWTRYSGFNPDITGGADNGPYPNTRVITGGVTLSF